MSHHPEQSEGSTDDEDGSHVSTKGSVTMTLLIKKALNTEDIHRCMRIRFNVFVQGQDVPIEADLDGKDPESSHYLLFINNEPAGVARVRSIDPYFKVERVGILAEHQGKGLGKHLIQFIFEDLKSQTSFKQVKLSSQTHAIPFYEKLGFTVCSEEYMDAGIPHKDMQMIFE